MEQLLRGNIWSKIPFTPQVLTRPRWLMRFLLDGGLPDMPNIVSPETGVLRVRDAHTAMKREVFSWTTCSGFARSGKARLSSRASSRQRMRSDRSIMARPLWLFPITEAANLMVFQRVCGFCRR